MQSKTRQDNAIEINTRQYDIRHKEKRQDNAK